MANRDGGYNFEAMGARVDNARVSKAHELRDMAMQERERVVKSVRVQGLINMVWEFVKWGLKVSFVAGGSSGSNSAVLCLSWSQ